MLLALLTSHTLTHTHQQLLRRCQWHRCVCVCVGRSGEAIKKLSGLTAKCYRVYLRPSVPERWLLVPCYSQFPCRGFLFYYYSLFCVVHLFLFHFQLQRKAFSQPLPKAASIKAVKAPQPIDSLIEYHYYQQLACTMTSVKIAN